MAGPHVVGLAALLISAQPALAGRVDEIENLIEQTAVHLTTTQGCGGDSSSQVPNNVFGWGRIDAWNAYQNVPHIITIDKTAWPPLLVEPGEVITYTINITHTHPISMTHQVVVTDVVPLGTSFLTATPPYTLNGELVQWELGDLGTQEGRWVQLVVEVWPDWLGPIYNENYGVKSDEVATVLGLEVIRMVGRYFNYFGFIGR